MRFVNIKTLAQQDLQVNHRIRSALIQQRTAKVNQIRGLLAEYGIILGQRIDVFRKALLNLLEDLQALSTNGLPSWINAPNR